MNPVIAALAQQVLAGQDLDRDQAARLAGLTDPDDLDDLFYWANKVRIRHFGRTVTFCSIVAGKVGGCSEDCKFCAQSARYQGLAGRAALDGESCPPGACTSPARPGPVAADQIVRCADEAADAGAQSFGVVNSGRGPSRADLDSIEPAIRHIARAGRVMPCASLGCLTLPAARRLAEMGVRRYNHNLETSRRFYPRIVTTHTFDDRLETLRSARQAGLGLCCGGIFNLGEDWEDRIDMALTIRQFQAEMAPLNFLHPIPGTPMADRPAMAPREILKIIALYRLMLPTTAIKVAGGREVNLRDLQSWMFYCGATSTMIGNYLTTSGRPPTQDRQMVRDLGLDWADTPGGQGAGAENEAAPVCEKGQGG